MGPNLEKNHAELGEKPVDRGPVETRFAGVQSAADGARPLMEAAFGVNVGSGDFFMPGAREKYYCRDADKMHDCCPTNSCN